MQTHDDYRKGIAGLSLTDLYREQERWHRAIDKCPGPFVRDCVPTYH